MKLFKISLLLGTMLLSMSSVKADFDRYHIFCPSGDQVTFEQDKDNWKATGEFDTYKFIGSLAIKTGVDPKPSEEGYAVPVRNRGGIFDLPCLYRVKNMNSALTITATIEKGAFAGCEAVANTPYFVCWNPKK